MTKYALLVGVTTYPKIPNHFGRDLRGCKNDVRGIREQLQRLGFSAPNIHPLINQDATREHILNKVDSLIRKVQEGDEVVLFYSGHGSQARPRSWPGRRFETIIPYDSGRGNAGPNRDIFDTEIDSWLTRFDQKAAFVTLIFDSCYSGGVGGSRGKVLVPARQEHGQAGESPVPRQVVADDRSAEELFRSEPKLKRRLEASFSRSFENAKGPSGWLPSQPRRARILAACEKFEWAWETFKPRDFEGTSVHEDKNAGRHGAFSYHLIEALKEQATWEAIEWPTFFKTVKDNVEDDKDQHPVMQSDDWEMPRLKRYAVVIGINDYHRDQPGEAWPKLRSAVPDAEKIAEILEHQQGDQGYESALDADMLQLNPSRQDLVEIFDELASELSDQVDSALVIYFAGHGAQEHVDDPAAQDFDVIKGYVVPRDGHQDDPSTWLAMSWLRERLDDLQCRHVLLILDCCYAGTFNLTRSLGTRSRKLYRSELDRFLRGRARQCLYSAAYDETASDFADSRGPAGERHSPFAKALIEALKGKADSTRGDYLRDNVITATELQQYIDEDLGRRSHQHRPRQTPGLSDLESAGSKGEFIFFVPGQKPIYKPDPRLDPSNNPWRGEEPFGPQDASLLFGRERVLVELLEWLVDPVHPVLVVTGASGSGKTSVIRAGLLHLLGNPKRLEKRTRAWAKRPELYDGSFTAEELARRVGTWRVAEANLKAAPQALTDATGRLRQSKSERRLLFVDHFEALDDELAEIAALALDPFDRAPALAPIDEMLSDSRPVKILVTLRSEAATAAEALVRRFGNRLRRYPLPSPTRGDLEEVIEGPAVERVLLLESGLSNKILEHVDNTPAPLPLLSIVLSQTYAQAYERRRQPDQDPLDRTLTPQDYASFGGVGGALLTRAEQLYAALQPDLQRTFRRLFLRMADVPRANGETGREVARHELDFADLEEQQRIDEILTQLIQARLVVIGGNQLEPASDALIGRWFGRADLAGEEPELTQHRLSILRKAGRAATEWHTGGRHQGTLWTGNPRLPQLLEIRSELNRIEQAFLDASYAELQAERARRLRAEAHLRLAIAGEWMSKDPTRAALVLLEIYGRERSAEHQIGEVFGVSRMREALAKGLCRAVFENHADVEALAFSPDGRHFVTASGDGTVRIWNAGLSSWTRTSQGGAASHAPAGKVRVLSSHASTLTDAAWSPDGRYIATASTDQTARVFRADGSGEPALLTGHQRQLRSVAWCPVSQDRRLVTASFDNTARVWNLQESNGELRVAGEPIVLEVPRANSEDASNDSLVDAAWSPDGERILTASDNRTARVWKADGSAEEFVLKHPGPVRDAAWHPDGKSILTVCTRDRAVRVWDAETGELSTRLGPREPVAFDAATDELRAAWSPDGRRIAIALTDGRVRIWTLATGAEGRGSDKPRDAPSESVTLPGHRKAVESLVWRPDSECLVTASQDGTARVWSLDGQLEPMILRGHQLPVSTAVWSPDGRCIVTAAYGGNLRIWDVSPYVPSDVGPRAADGSGTAFPAELASFADAGIGDRVIQVSPKPGIEAWDACVGQPTDTVFLEAFDAEFSADGDRVVVDHGHDRRVWNLEGSGAEILGEVFNREPAPSQSNPSEPEILSPDGRRQLVRAGSEVRIFQVDTEAETKGDPIVLRHPSEVLLAAFNTSGDRIVTVCETVLAPRPRSARRWTLRVWDLKNDPSLFGQPVHLQGPPWTEGVLWIAIDPEGRRIVARPMVGPASVWNADGSGEPLVLPGALTLGGRVVFSPDGSCIAATSLGAVRVSRIGRAALQARIRQTTTASLEPEFRASALGESPLTAWKHYAEDELAQGRCPRAWSFDPEDPESAELFLKRLSPKARERYEACRQGQPVGALPSDSDIGPVTPPEKDPSGTENIPEVPGSKPPNPVESDSDVPDPTEEPPMSVHNVSRFVAHLALDYKDLATYSANPRKFFPKGRTQIQQLCGKLNKEERQLLRGGDFAKMFEYILANAPKPIIDDPPIEGGSGG